MTMGKLAKTSGVPEWRIDHYELGKNEIALSNLLKIACALGLAMQEIFINSHHRCIES